MRKGAILLAVLLLGNAGPAPDYRTIAADAENARPQYATGVVEHDPQAELLETFRTFCLAEEASGGAFESAATRAGFQRVPVKPGPGWQEKAAWQRGGTRLFSLAGATGPTPDPICGVGAKIGRLGEDKQLLDPVAEMVEVAFIEGNPGSVHSGWVIAGRKRFVRVSIDRSDPADVGVVLLGQRWPGEAAK